MRRGPGSIALGLGLAGALVAFTATFQGPRSRFWQRMTFTGARLGAAGVAGAHWCALYAAGVPLGALVVSHVAWDVWIFLVQPTGEVERLAMQRNRESGGSQRR